MKYLKQFSIILLVFFAIFNFPFIGFILDSLIVALSNLFDSNYLFGAIIIIILLTPIISLILALVIYNLMMKDIDLSDFGGSKENAIIMLAIGFVIRVFPVLAVYIWAYNFGMNALGNSTLLLTFYNLAASLVMDFLCLKVVNFEFNGNKKEVVKKDEKEIIEMMNEDIPVKATKYYSLEWKFNINNQDNSLKYIFPEKYKLYKDEERSGICMINNEIALIMNNNIHVRWETVEIIDSGETQNGMKYKLFKTEDKINAFIDFEFCNMFAMFVGDSEEMIRGLLKETYFELS